MGCVSGYCPVNHTYGTNIETVIESTKKNLSSNFINVILLNSIHKLVKETLHRAFWEKLDAELKEVPPNFTQAMVLLEDVKEVMFVQNVYVNLVFISFYLLLHCKCSVILLVCSVW